MERIGVIRENGIVINAILWNDTTAEQLEADGVTDYEEITGLNPRPGIGWLWDEEHQYRPPKPYPSWVWEDDKWTSPVPHPDDGKTYNWSEAEQSWIELIPQTE